MDAVTPDFLETAGIELLRGRPLAASDRADGMPVALVNEAFARRFFPGEDPVGLRFVFGSGWPEGEEVPWMTIVGVVGDVRRSGLDQEVRPSAFLPHDQYRERRMTVLVRTTGDPLALAEPARRAARVNPMTALRGE